MNRTHVLTGFALAAGALVAQTPPSAGILYQQAGAVSMGAVKMVHADFFGPESVSGSPYSATHKSHSLQVLGDGTRLENTESRQVFRDSQGRTRTETGTAGSRIITIQDPVGGVLITLNEANRTAEKTPMPRLQVQKTAVSGLAVARAQLETRTFEMRTATPVPAAPPPGVMTQGVLGGTVPVPGPPMAVGATNVMYAAGPGYATTTAIPAMQGIKPETEELPIQNVNGVLASGRRTSLTIPMGDIGNDRPIRVTSETWYSNDLQTVVKSSNSDPRFGDTTFELTNINRVEPDPSVFQIPGDYTIAEGKAFFNLQVPPPPPPAPQPK